jgi:hypothetical protein
MVSEADIHIQIAFFAGGGIVRQSGIDISSDAGDTQIPRVVPTFAPLPTAQPTPTASPTARP